MHAVLVAGMANSKPYAPEFSPEMAIDRAQPVMARRSAARLHLDLERGEVEFVMEHGQRGQIQLQNPIKELGVHTVSVALHPEVSAEVTVNVARSEEEARRQSEPDKDEALAEAEAIFETEELAEQATKVLTGEEEAEEAASAEEEPAAE